jgi:hypothetical protein
MNQVLADRLRTVEVLESQTVGCMHVFGLRWNCHDGIGYRTLDEALAAETLDITETSEGGSVPLLKLLNRGDDAVFLMAGEQLVGAKQNRILNTSILAAAHGDLTIPVSCVEGYAGVTFRRNLPAPARCRTASSARCSPGTSTRVPRAAPGRSRSRARSGTR